MKKKETKENKKNSEEKERKIAVWQHSQKDIKNLCLK